MLCLSNAFHISFCLVCARCIFVLNTLFVSACKVYFVWTKPSYYTIESNTKPPNIIIGGLSNLPCSVFISPIPLTLNLDHSVTLSFFSLFSNILFPPPPSFFPPLFFPPIFYFRYDGAANKCRLRKQITLPRWESRTQTSLVCANTAKGQLWFKARGWIAEIREICLFCLSLSLSLSASLHGYNMSARAVSVLSTVSGIYTYLRSLKSRGRKGKGCTTGQILYIT